MTKKRDHVAEDIYKPFYMARPRQMNSPSEMAVESIELMLQRIVGELCINRFNWKGLPDSVDTRFMELTLYHYALAVIFEDNVTGKLLVARATPGNGYDMNQNPLSYRILPFSTGTLPEHLRNLTLSARNVVPVWGNAFRQPDLDTVMFYSQRLAQTERTIDINLKAARRTKVLAYDENQRLSIQNINAAMERGDATIPVNLGTQELKDMVSLVDFGLHPEAIERLSVVRDRFWGNLMGLLGINNANQDKKERLVASEVEGNDDQVGNFRRINLNWRQKAAKEVMKKWPDLLEEKVSVNYHTDIDAARPLFPDEVDPNQGIATAEQIVNKAGS